MTLGLCGKAEKRVNAFGQFASPYSSFLRQYEAAFSTSACRPTYSGTYIISQWQQNFISAQQNDRELKMTERPIHGMLRANNESLMFYVSFLGRDTVVSGKRSSSLIYCVYILDHNSLGQRN